jgi:predicted ATPase
MVNRKENFFVLAGTSGTGKSSVLDRLREKGFLCFDESARAVLEEQLAADGPALPSKNPLLFIQEMLERDLKNFAAVQKHKRPVFFDRALPDLVHYAVRFGVDPKIFEAAAERYLYNRTVFVFAPWREIFVNDNVRKMTFEKSVEFHSLLVSTYERLDYNLVAVPTGSVESRADFIVNFVIHRQ